MLIVGTKGRSLGGLQGLVSNRNSFSKWCLQHSPIPVVVVRPTSKRMKKKMKRENAPARHDYKRILKESGIDEHETDTCSQGTMWEISNESRAEANAVHTAVDPTAGPESVITPVYCNRKQNSESAKSDQRDSTNITKEYSSPIFPSSPIIIPQSNLDSFVASGKENCIESYPIPTEAETDCEKPGAPKTHQSLFQGENISVDKNIKTDSLANHLPKKHSNMKLASDNKYLSPDCHAVRVSEDINQTDFDFGTSDFEIIPGKHVLEASGVNPSSNEVGPEELGLHEFLSIRETTFLAAQIARNLSMDKYMFRDYDAES